MQRQKITLQIDIFVEEASQKAGQFNKTEVKDNKKN